MTVEYAIAGIIAVYLLFVFIGILVSIEENARYYPEENIIAKFIHHD